MNNNNIQSITFWLASKKPEQTSLNPETSSHTLFGKIFPRAFPRIAIDAVKSLPVIKTITNYVKSSTLFKIIRKFLPSIDNDTKIHSFPFFTKKLPSIENEKDLWWQKTGLTYEETKYIENYVSKHLVEWENLPLKQVLRIPKEESKLPRTIHVYRAYGKLCIQILCKIKNNLNVVGKGENKKGKVSIEWLTKTLWVQYVISKEKWEDVQKGIQIQDKIPRQLEIFPSPQGRSFYMQEGKPLSERYSFFGPLRDGHLGDLIINNEIFQQQKHFVAHQLLKALASLEENNIFHNDIHEDNILFYLDDNKQIHIELSDFDLATDIKPKITYDLEEILIILKNIYQKDNCPKVKNLLQTTHCTAQEILKHFEVIFNRSNI